jgi:hypothetical protein
LRRLQETPNDFKRFGVKDLKSPQQTSTDFERLQETLRDSKKLQEISRDSKRLDNSETCFVYVY